LEFERQKMEEYLQSKKVKKTNHEKTKQLKEIEKKEN